MAEEDVSKVAAELELTYGHLTMKQVRKQLKELVQSNTRETEDEFATRYGKAWADGHGSDTVILEPLFNPARLEDLTQHNSALGPCIDAYETNIDGTSYEIVPWSSDDDRDKFKNEIAILEGFFDRPSVNPAITMTSLRGELRQDVEKTGNAYIEVLRSLDGEIMFLRRVDPKTVRLLRLTSPIEVVKTVRRAGKEHQVTMQVRERRFVQVVAGHATYYREYGSSRHVHRDLGFWDGPIDDKTSGFVRPVEPQFRATEIIHLIAVRDPLTPYGLPRWIPQLPSVLGSRQAEELNLAFFDAGGVPPALVIVSGGTLAKQTADAITSLSTQTGKARSNLQVISVNPSSGSIDKESPVRVTVERFGCHDDQTEVLTDQGWVPFASWGGQRVATVSPEGALEYQAPLAVQRYLYEGPMVRIEGAAVSVCVTPNHRMWLESPHKVGSRRFELAKHTLGRSNARFPVSAVAEGETLGSFEVGGVLLPGVAMLEFLGCFIADGSTTSYREGREHLIKVSVKKERKINRILMTWWPKLVEAVAGSICTTSDGHTVFSLHDRRLWEWLRETVGTYAWNKRIPRQFLSLSAEQSEVLLKAMLVGDGTRYDKGAKDSWIYTTTSPRLADDVQELAVRCGFRTVRSLVKDRVQWSVSITPKKIAHVTKGKCLAWTEVDYSGMVYCFTVPNGTLLTRRDGKVLISGNSERQNDSMFKEYDKCTERKVRTAFRIPGIFVGDTDDYNFACYDEETETLTDQGWIRWHQFKPGMRVACVDPETQALRFEEPFGSPEVYDVDEVEMYRFHGQNLDMMVTPRHRMMWRTELGRVHVAPVEEMVSSCSRPSLLARCSAYEGGERLGDFAPPWVPLCSGRNFQHDCPPALVPARDALALIAWYVSKGHVLPQECVVGITQKTTRHWPEIEALMARLEGSGYRVWCPAEGLSGVRQMLLANKSWWAWLLQHAGKKSREKKIPELVKALPEDQLSEFFDVLMAGDGTWDPRPGRRSGAYSTASRQLADDVQEVAVRLGYRAKLVIRPHGTERVHPVYRILLSKGCRSGGGGDWQSVRYDTHLTRQLYTGKVYCFSVPTGVFVTRRNGVVAMQGNTAFAAYMVTEAQVFAGLRQKTDDLINATLMVELDPTGGKLRYRSMPITLKDMKLQMDALGLLADRLPVDEVIRQVNTISGLTVQAPTPEQIKELLEAQLTISQGDPANVEEMEKGKVRVEPSIPPIAAGGGSRRPSRAKAELRGVEVVADEVAAVLRTKGANGFNREEGQRLMQVLGSLRPDQMREFRGRLAMKMFLQPVHDQEGLGEIAIHALTLIGEDACKKIQ